LYTGRFHAIEARLILAENKPMKHLFLKLTLLLPLAAIAQPEFTKNDMYPVGFSYQKMMVNPNEVPTEITGANSTWNFELFSMGSATETAEAFSTQGAYQSFPEATFVFGSELGSDSLYRYFVVNDNSFALNGFFVFPNDGFPPPPGSNGPMVYNPPLDIFRFPSTMGSAFTQTINGTKNQLPDTILRKGQQTVTFDGYGTLTTAAGTFQNALRFYTEQQYVDSTSANGVVNTYEVKSWSWISPATRGVILLHKEIMVKDNDEVPDTTAWYTNPGDVGFDDAQKRSFIIYPNPMHDVFTLSGQAETGNLTVDLLSITGQYVQRLYTGNLNGQFYNLQLSLKTVEPGFYFVNLLNGDKTESYPVVVR
jgi:hypothetical protein